MISKNKNLYNILLRNLKNKNALYLNSFKYLM